MFDFKLLQAPQSSAKLVALDQTTGLSLFDLRTIQLRATTVYDF